jgi:BMFP domain-containing protein YqiC
MLANGLIMARREQLALERRVDELEAELRVLRGRVAMLDGGAADVPGSGEDDFWRQLFESYGQDDYDAFVLARGPLLAKLDIVERAGMMEELHEVASAVCSRPPRRDDP